MGLQAKCTGLVKAQIKSKDAEKYCVAMEQFELILKNYNNHLIFPLYCVWSPFPRITRTR